MYYVCQLLLIPTFFPSRWCTEGSVWRLAQGNPAAASDAAEVFGGADWGSQKVKKGPVSQAENCQESRARASWGGRRAAETCDRATGGGAETAGTGKAHT